MSIAGLFPDELEQPSAHPTPDGSEKLAFQIMSESSYLPGSEEEKASHNRWAANVRALASTLKRIRKD